MNHNIQSDKTESSMNFKKSHFALLFRKKAISVLGLILTAAFLTSGIDPGRSNAVASKAKTRPPVQRENEEYRAASPDETLHVTARLSEREAEAGEYRQNKARSGHWKETVGGKAHFSIERSEEGREEVVTLTLRCSIPGWKKDWTPLHQAAVFGDLAGICKALEQGTPIDAAPRFLTPLHLAVIGDEEEAVRYLLQKGANLQAKTFNGELPAALAYSCRHPNLGRLLTVFVTAKTVVEKKAPVRVSLSHGRTADLTAELKRIALGEKDEHRHDGTVFLNREGKLPRQDHYYYTEFVHRVSDDRSPGACRIVIGAKGDVWYTPDHYNTFIRVDR